MLKVSSFVFILLLGGLLDFLFLRPAVTKPANAFAQFYFAAQLVDQGEVARIYQPKAYEPLVEKLETEDFQDHPFYYYNRPAYAAPLYWPYSLVSYAAGARLFVALNFVLWGLLIWKLPRWLDAPTSVRVWLFSLFPFAYAVAIGQDTLALTLLLAYSMCVLIHRNQTAAGIVLGLCLVKPHLIVLMPLLLLAERKHRALLSFAATGIALAGVSVALVGFHGIQEWLELLAAPTTDFYPENMGTVRALGLQFGTPTAFAAGAIALAAGVFAFLRANYLNRLSIILMLALLLNPHAYWGDYALLSIVALATTNRLIRYGILLPWPFFLPLAMWPMVIGTIFFLLLMALDAVGSPSQASIFERLSLNREKSVPLPR